MVKLRKILQDLIEVERLRMTQEKEHPYVVERMKLLEHERQMNREEEFRALISRSRHEIAVKRAIRRETAKELWEAIVKEYGFLFQADHDELKRVWDRKLKAMDAADDK
jgi:hypothetical protein